MTPVDKAVMQATNDAASGMMGEKSPLHAILIVPVYQNDPGSYSSTPVVLGDPESFPYLCASLRMLIAKIESGEFEVFTKHNAPGGDA